MLVAPLGNLPKAPLNSDKLIVNVLKARAAGAIAAGDGAAYPDSVLSEACVVAVGTDQ